MGLVTRTADLAGQLQSLPVASLGLIHVPADPVQRSRLGERLGLGFPVTEFPADTQGLL
jgi:hypothetical protein